MKIPENIKQNVEYIEKAHKIKVSKFMLSVLSILSKTFGGLHHTDVESIWKAKDFTQTRYIEYGDWRNNLSTFDYSDLTHLVLLGHEKGIRISIGVNRDSTRAHKLIIGFGNRMGNRTGDICRRHPTLNKVIKEYAK